MPPERQATNFWKLQQNGRKLHKGLDEVQVEKNIL